MKKREAEFTTKFLRWARKNSVTGAYEVKHTRGEEKFNKKELHAHQRDALVACRIASFAYKIPDDGYAYKPFDLFVLNKTAAYLVICFPKTFALLLIDQVIAHRGKFITQEYCARKGVVIPLSMLK